MMKRVIFLVFLLVNIPVWGAEGEDALLLQESGQDALIVLGAGLSGAILGLSTLSFAEEPGDHLKNIVVGGALGLIVGVVAVAYKQATKTKTNFSNEAAQLTPSFNTANRLGWHQGQQMKVQQRIGAQIPSLGYSFSF